MNEIKGKLGFEDHPYGDFIGVSALVMTNLESIRNAAKEEGKAEALKGLADDNRKKSIKSNVLPIPKSKIAVSKSTPSQVVKVAKQMGMNKGQTKIYAQLMSKSKNTVAIGD